MNYFSPPNFIIPLLKSKSAFLFVIVTLSLLWILCIYIHEGISSLPILAMILWNTLHTDNSCAHSCQFYWTFIQQPTVRAALVSAFPLSISRLTKKEKKAVHSLSAVMFSLSLLSRFCPVHPKTAQWGLRLESVPATPCFQAYHLVLYSWFWHSLDLFFGSLSCCGMTNPRSTRPEAVAWRRTRLW